MESRRDTNDNGEVVVVGGVRRLHPGELPTIKLPTEIPAAEKVGP